MYVREYVEAHVEADEVPKLERPRTALWETLSFWWHTARRYACVSSVLLGVMLHQLSTSFRHPSSIAAAVFSTSSRSTSTSFVSTPSSSISPSAALHQYLTSLLGSIPSSLRQKLPKASHKVRALFARDRYTRASEET